MSLSSKSKPTKLISTDENLFVEVDSLFDQYTEISRNYAEAVNGTIDIAPLIQSIYEKIKAIQGDALPEQIEVEINIGVDAEGNTYLTQLGSQAHFGIKMIYKNSGE